MGSWRNLAVFATATCVALGAAREAGATASDFYGNNFDENVLVPFAQCGPGGNDTLFAVTNPGVPAWPLATGLHVFVWNRDSIEACDFTVPFTPLDVYPDSFCRILAENCSDTGRALLDNGDGSSVAYITIEGDAGGLDVNVGDALYGSVYYTDLGNNRATGLPAATFDPTSPNPGVIFDSVLLDEFPLLGNHQISFRFLQALAGDRNSASTRGIIWSATTGACTNTATASIVPDSNCLVGTGASGSVNYCDEAEVCTSGPRPPVDREVNIFSIDAFVPGVFGTDGGYFNLQSNIAFGVPQVGPFLQTTDVHLIGITDQEATIGGTPAVRAAFYAPRD